MASWTILQKNTDTVIAAGHEDDDSVMMLEDNWYFSPHAVDMTHLKLTNRTYTCPYKGVCFWLDLDAPGIKARNIAWVYQQPKPGYERIKDRIAFYTRETLGTMAVVLPE
jgi:uncharacterized protein (DUF427 family)